jgi:predicted nucleotidyltransferase
LFSMMPDRDRAEEIYRMLVDLGLETYIVQTVARA